MQFATVSLSFFNRVWCEVNRKPQGIPINPQTMQKARSCSVPYASSPMLILVPKEAYRRSKKPRKPGLTPAPGLSPYLHHRPFYLLAPPAYFFFPPLPPLFPLPSAASLRRASRSSCSDLAFSASARSSASAFFLAASASRRSRTSDNRSRSARA